MGKYLHMYVFPHEHPWTTVRDGYTFVFYVRAPDTANHFVPDNSESTDVQNS